jgi:hypothetical protein
MFDRADVQFARVRDDIRQISATGRGWRLTDPFKGIWKRLTRKKPVKKEPSDFDLSEDEMRSIMNLIHKRATTQSSNTFAVHGPRKLLENRDLATSDDVIEQLKDSAFVVVFQDGTAQLLSLVELMVFTYNLIVLQWQYYEVSKMVQAVPPGDRDFNVSFEFSVDDIMRPEMVKTLLRKITFSDVPSDECDAASKAKKRGVGPAPDT